MWLTEYRSKRLCSPRYQPNAEELNHLPKKASCDGVVNPQLCIFIFVDNNIEYHITRVFLTDLVYYERILRNRTKHFANRCWVVLNYAILELGFFWRSALLPIAIINRSVSLINRVLLRQLTVYPFTARTTNLIGIHSVENDWTVNLWLSCVGQWLGVSHCQSLTVTVSHDSRSLT